MAVSITSKIPDATCDARAVKVRELTFSGNYATGGESVTAADVGLRRLDSVIPHGGVAVSSDLTTAIPIFYNHGTAKFVFYEGSAAATALTEKTNAEPYPTGCNARVTFIGRA
jgi:hypothetical protein